MKQRIRLLTIISMLPLFFAASTLSADPNTSVMRKGIRYYKNQLYKEALGFFQQGMEKNEKSLAPHFNTGAALYKMENYIQAIESLTESLERTKDDEES